MSQPSAGLAGRPVHWLLAATIFLGAFLLFQIQPLIGKAILPWFGGGPAVWTTSMLFFQVLLLAGYAYADFTVRWLPRTGQFWAHVGLLGVALAVLPVLPGPQWQPTSSAAPQSDILLLLAASVGLPYFVLATTAPLVQAWYARLSPAGSPYRLYALSNVGSLLALLSYPFVVEPSLALTWQDRVWSCGFVVFGLLCVASAWFAWRKGHPLEAAASEPDAPPTPLSHKMLWVLLPAGGSALYLGATNIICQDVAVFPLLWVVPLALYLLTFILCFDSTRWYRRDWFLVGAYATAIYAAELLSSPPNIAFLLQLATYLGAMFFGCMVCHGEVVRLKPPPQRLTGFYLSISAGGALGGVLAGIVAPRVFLGYYEFHAGLLLVWVLALAVMFLDPQSILYRGRARDMWAILLVMTAVFGWKLWQSERAAAQLTIARSRNFYGTLGVTEMPDPKGRPDYKRLELRHGRIVHGAQFAAKEKQHLPLRYYSEESGVGLAFRLLPRKSQRRVAVVGLGAGTLAAYGQAGDEFRFYEINPEVVRLATKYFTFLEDTRARAEVIVGDARLKLTEELPADRPAHGQSPRPFDLIVLDAFSGDAVPAHLLTQEAFATYLKLLAPDGIIAVHVSSLHLDLTRVLRAHAQDFQLAGLVVEDAGDVLEAKWQSVWVLLAKDPKVLAQPPVPELLAITAQALANPVPEKRPRVVAAPLTNEFSAQSEGVRWTDDYSNILGVLRTEEYRRMLRFLRPWR
jgi:SAM-dependent methyltransferase